MTKQDPIAVARALDDCWLARRFEELDAYFTHDAMVIAHGGRHTGIEAVIESYREFMGSTEVRVYTAFNHVAIERDDAAIVEFDWSMDWATDDQPHSGTGHEILAFVCREDAWRVFWRTQNFAIVQPPHSQLMGAIEASQKNRDASGATTRLAALDQVSRPLRREAHDLA